MLPEIQILNALLAHFRAAVPEENGAPGIR